jgi:hypothetical protein
MKTSSCFGGRIQAYLWLIFAIWAAFGHFLERGNRGVLRAFPGVVSGKRGLIRGWIGGVLLRNVWYSFHNNSSGKVSGISPQPRRYPLMLLNYTSRVMISQ